MRKIYLVPIACILIFSVFWGYSRHQHAKELPSKTNPLHFYSPQTNDHLQRVLLNAISKAENSIWIRIYGMTDKKVIELINSKAELGLDISISYDAKASKSLKNRLSKKITTFAYKGRGILHQKLCIIDKSDIWFGSTNFTSKSLLMHDNLLIGLYDPILAKHLLEQKSSSYQSFLSELYTFHLLPCDCIDELIEYIGQAKHSMKIAMFTWTNQRLLKAIIEAKHRGVDISVVGDRSAIKGVSKHVFASLIEEGISVHIQKGLPLMHHKFLLIDNSLLLTGSANWTKAAFGKNKELLFIYPLRNKKEKKYFKKFWKALWNDTFIP